MHRTLLIWLSAALAVSACDGAPAEPAPPADADVAADARPAADGGPPSLDAQPTDGALPDGPPADAGTPQDAEPDASPPDAGCEALRLLEARCATGGCHLPNNRRTGLVLTRAAMEAGSLAGYVLPGRPDDSALLTRMRSAEAGPLMPLGSVHPLPELPRLEAWVAAGASTRCDLPQTAAPSDPNHLDPEALFTCVDRQAVATPARLRRVERQEWTRAVVKPVAGTWWGSTAKDNPFATPARLPYSTYPADVSVDPATLDLYLLVLPEAPATWNARDPVRGAEGIVPGTRTEVVYRDAELRCIFQDAAPDDPCVDRYVDTFLRHGVLFRTPTEGEHARLRALLVQALADEADPGDRRLTLQFVGEAAFLMAGALFRSEVGAPDGAGGWRLTADELALAVGRVLSTHPVGAPLPISVQTGPDAEVPARGRLGLVWQAAQDGTIHQPAVIRDLLAAYQGGVDPARADLAGEEDARGIPGRGDYWLADNLQQFFREWLGYGTANTVFKDTPGATSQWDVPGSGGMWDRTTGGFRNLQSGYVGYEATLTQQLDDTIARAVVESHAQGADVFEALLTTRRWRLPSNLADVDGACAEDADCPAGQACTPLGRCGGGVANTSIYQTRVFDLDHEVPATDEGRWVDVPADERAGVLTHPAWLAAHGGNFEDDASAVQRGRWIRERLLCETVPGLSLVQAEAKLVASAPHLSARERLRLSVEDPAANPYAPTCMGCHTLMNSLGAPFEIYNHAGFLRAFDHGPDGAPVPPDGHSALQAAPEPALAVEVDDAVALAELLSTSRVARRCFVRQTFRYFAGRDETLADACVLADMEAALDTSGSFFDMLAVLVTAPGFQRRVPPQGAP